MASGKGPVLEVLMIGPTGSGKTTLVRRMKQVCKLKVPDEPLDTMPTLGVELDTLPYRTSALTVRELGGSFEAVWSNFYSDCGAWAFVVDLSDSKSLAEGTVSFLSVASSPEMAGKERVLVLAKADAPTRTPLHDLDTILRLEDLRRTMGARLHVIETNSLEDSVRGVEQLLDTLAGIADRAHNATS